MLLKRRKAFYLTIAVIIASTIFIGELTLLLKIFSNSVDDQIITGSLKHHAHRNEAIHQNIQAFESRYIDYAPVAAKDDLLNAMSTEKNLSSVQKRIFSKYSFNELESEKIGLLRNIPDNRLHK